MNATGHWIANCHTISQLLRKHEVHLSKENISIPLTVFSPISVVLSDKVADRIQCLSDLSTLKSNSSDRNHQKLTFWLHEGLIFSLWLKWFHICIILNRIHYITCCLCYSEHMIQPFLSQGIPLNNNIQFCWENIV